MPTYEYHCLKCDHSFDAVQSMKDPHFETCPEALCCIKPWGKGKVVRQLGTGAGLIFKGSGFYITDYRSESYKKGAEKDKSPKTTEASPSSTPKKEPSAAPPSNKKPSNSSQSSSS